MCLVKKVTVPTTNTSAEKQVAIVRNTYLDGLDPVTKALRVGRSSLRIERGAAGAGGQAGTPAGPTSPAVPPVERYPDVGADNLIGDYVKRQLMARAANKNSSRGKAG